MYFITNLYPTGIRPKVFSLETIRTSEVLEVIDTKGGGLNKKGRAGSFVEPLYQEDVSEIRGKIFRKIENDPLQFGS